MIEPSAAAFAQAETAKSASDSPTERMNTRELQRAFDIATARALREPTTAELDAALEREIETAHRAYLRAVELDDTPSVRECFDVMAALISQRSPEQISRMEERIEGLR